MENNKDFRDYYKIEKKLAENKFYCIYEVITNALNEKIAIKVIDKQMIKKSLKNNYSIEPNSEEMKILNECLLNEITNMKIAEGKNNDNENAVKFYEYFNTEKELAIVMELCDENLLNFLPYIKEEEKFGIINQINKTLKILVENEVLYFNLNLKNILIKFKNKEKSEFIVKLKMNNDIGLIKQFPNLFNDIITKNENIVLCPPEILKEENYNEKSDLWNLGVIIYVLFFNDYPYRGKTSSEILNQIYIGEKLLKKSENPELDDLIRKLLIEKPEQRLSWNKYFNHNYFKQERQKQNVRMFYEIDENKKIEMLKYAIIYKAKEKESKKLRTIEIYNKMKIKNDIRKKKFKEPSEEDMKEYIDAFNNEKNITQIIQDINKTNYSIVKFYEFFNTEKEFAIVRGYYDISLLSLLLKKKEPFKS